MALTIDKVHERIEFLVKKNQWGYISHEQIDICLDMSQLELFEDYYGNPNKYQAGRPIPPVSYGSTNKVQDSLRNFITTETIDVTFAPAGLITIPTDYRDYLGAFITYTDSGNTVTHELDMVSEAQRGIALNSQLFSVRSTADLSSSFISMVDSGFQIYPATTYAGQFTYLRLPAVPVFGYTQVGRTITYASGSSTQLEWGDDDIDKIIQKALGFIAIGLEDDRLFQQSRIKDKE